MTLPRIYVEFDAVNEPTNATRTWTDISSRWREISTRRGRRSMLEQIGAGECTLVLSNRDGWLSPDNTVSPYYPNWDAVRPIRVRATHPTGDVGLFSGFIESITPVTVENADAFVIVSCIDGFMALGLHELVGGYDEELTSDRLGTVLDEALFPASPRSIETGSLSVQAQILYNEDAAGHVRKVTETEFGQFFFAGDGTPTFQSRQYRSLNSAVAYTFGGGAGLPFRDVQRARSAAGIFNRVVVQRQGGEEQSVTSGASWGRYFKRTLSRQTLHTADAEALQHATNLLNILKNGITHVPVLQLQGRDTAPQDDALYRAMLQLEISDRIRVIRRDPGSAARGDGAADTFLKDVWVEGIEHDIRAQGTEWITTISTSPTEWYAVWILGDSQASVLSETTRTGY